MDDPRARASEPGLFEVVGQELLDAFRPYEEVYPGIWSRLVNTGNTIRIDGDGLYHDRQWDRLNTLAVEVQGPLQELIGESRRSYFRGQAPNFVAIGVMAQAFLTYPLEPTFVSLDLLRFHARVLHTWVSAPLSPERRPFEIEEVLYGVAWLFQLLGGYFYGLSRKDFWAKNPPAFKEKS